MRKSTSLILAACASCLAGCSSTGSASDGTGYKLITPSSLSRAFILSNDIDLARQIAGHNDQCRKDAGCQK